MSKNRLSRRRWPLAIILVAIVTLLLLASGLSSLAISVEAPTPALPTVAIPEEAAETEEEEELPPREPVDVRTVIAILVVYFLLLVATYVFFPEMRLPLLTAGIVVGMLFGYWYFFIYRQPAPEVQVVQEAYTDEETAAAIETVPEAPDYIRDASDEVDLVFSLLIVGAVAGIGLFLWYRLRPEPPPEDTLDALTETWEDALSDLQANRCGTQSCAVTWR